MDLDKKNTISTCAFNILFTKDVPHIHEKIFFSLDYESFKFCVKVCKTWCRLITSESFLERAKSHFIEIERDEHLLWLASKGGKIKEVGHLLSTWILDVNCKFDEKIFFSMNLNQDYESRRLNTPLHRAARCNQKGMVQLLLDNGADSERENWMGGTPLLVAISSGHNGVIQILLDNGADPNRAHRQDGGTPLHRAARIDNENVMKLLLRGGADPHKCNKIGATPLHVASMRGNTNMVEMLLNPGADPNKEDHHGETPLHWASKMGHTNVVQMLLQGGARPEKRNKKGENPLHLAKQHGRDDVFRVLFDFIHLKCYECARETNIPTGTDGTFNLCSLL